MVFVTSQKIVARPESSSELTSLSSNTENDLGGKLDQNRSLLDSDGLANSLKPDMWRTWSIQRAGFSDASFEGLLFSNTNIWWFHGLTDWIN